MRNLLQATLFLLPVIGLCLAHAEALDPAIQQKLDAKIKAAQAWTADASIINAVKAHNATPSPVAVAMTQEQWKTASVLDPFVRSFTKHPAAEYLKSKKNESQSEAFLSGADGTKVAFLAKTSSWSHKGKAKHDEPMSGKCWQGVVELDESTGQQQIQISVPVLDGDKPIGSLVLAFNVLKLAKE
jgi:hypothetical protein